MKSILRLSLPVLLLCASWHTAFSADPNRNYSMWEREISAYERADATNPPPKGGIEFIGSSVIARWKTLKKDFPGQPVYDRGFGGSEIVDSTHFADRIVFPYAPAKIFFRAGGNDLWAGKSSEQVFTDYQEFTALVHSNLPNTEIYFISWNATPSRWKQHDKEKALNNMVEAFVQDKPYLKYIENYDIAFDAEDKLRPELFVADQLHFNAAGYKLLTARIWPYLTNSPTAGPANGTTK
jgi:hypothetical protein